MSVIGLYGSLFLSGLFLVFEYTMSPCLIVSVSLPDLQQSFIFDCFVWWFCNYGPGPHWGTVRKKMSPGLGMWVMCTAQYIHCIMIIIITTYQIIIEVSELRQHKQRLNDLRTQLGWWNSYILIRYTITISANEAKTQEEELMQQWTTNNEPRRAA